MKILISVASVNEVRPLIRFFNFVKIEKNLYEKKINNIFYYILITSVGGVAVSYYLTKFLANNKVDMLINTGICGCFDYQYPLGQIVEIIEEEFADFGVNDNGVFKTFFEEGFYDKNIFPFREGKLINNDKYLKYMKSLQYPKLRSITVNTSSGETKNIEYLKQKFNVDIENMEGAAFFFVSLSEKIPFLEIRVISNYVEPRDKSRWNLDIAIENLNKEFINLIKGGHFKTSS